MNAQMKYWNTEYLQKFMPQGALYFNIKMLNKILLGENPSDFWDSSDLPTTTLMLSIFCPLPCENTSVSSSQCYLSCNHWFLICSQSSVRLIRHVAPVDRLPRSTQKHLKGIISTSLWRLHCFPLINGSNQYNYWLPMDFHIKVENYIWP